jgi:hypothetical protein
VLDAIDDDGGEGKPREDGHKLLQKVDPGKRWSHFSWKLSPLEKSTIAMSACLCICPPLPLFVCLPLYLSICLSVCLSVCPPPLAAHSLACCDCTHEDLMDAINGSLDGRDPLDMDILGGRRVGS